MPEEQETKPRVKADTTTLEESESNSAKTEEPAVTLPLPAKQKIKKPHGIYKTHIPFNGKMEQTVAFYDDLTYQLQETYTAGKKDSTVITQGNWSPSDGYIWLYKDEVVRGRYSWKGDTLQYFNPVLKKSFSMRPLKDATENTAWSSKPKEGVVVLGIGNEPFWSIEVKKKDSISFLLSEWTAPVTLKISSSSNSADSTSYIAKNDSTQLRLTIFPVFCSDGMSDYVYRNKMRIQFNNQVFNGCGIVYK